MQLVLETSWSVERAWSGAWSWSSAYGQGRAHEVHHEPRARQKTKKDCICNNGANSNTQHKNY